MSKEIVEGMNLSATWQGYPMELQVKWHNKYAREKRKPRTDEQLRAQELVDLGYVQVSRKYRQVVCVGAPGHSYQTLKAVDPNKAREILRQAWENFKAELERNSIHVLQSKRESLQLDEATFEEFRRLVGNR